MKGSEAARYARWSAALAVAILVLAAGVYLHRQFAEKVARRGVPPPVQANVQQQSVQFSYSKVLGNRTLFTVRASRATEYKDQNRSMLEEVLITIYGRNGDRNDTISAHECSYVPATGQIRCQGAVQIDLRNAGESGNAVRTGMYLETRDISFDYASEEVSTPSDILLRFPGGSGHATGVKYDAKNEVVRLESKVRLKFERPGGRLASPVSLRGTALEFHRNTRLIQFYGPVTVRQGGRTIETGILEMYLDEEMRPRRAVASNGVQSASADPHGAASLAAERMETILGAGGAIEHIVTNGNIRGEQKISSGERRFSAQHAEMTMSISNGRSEPRELLANGNIEAEIQENGVRRHLDTSSLRGVFLPLEKGRGVRLARAETLAPGEIAISQPGESDNIRAGKFVAEFNAEGRLAKLGGAAGVGVERQMGVGATQATTAKSLAVAFNGGRDWTTLQENGSVNFRQGDRTAQADRAGITRATNEIVLDGNAMVTDAASSTSAAHIEISQLTGEVHANGSVVSSYSGARSEQPTSFGTGTVHISADRFDASSTAGRETYSGHARLWQDDAVLDADTIELWRDQKKLEAQGDVRGVLPEVSGEARKNTTPALWQVRAPKMEYWSNAGKLELTGGVQAKSQKGAITAQALEFLLASDAQKQQHLQRAVAEGNVRIEANGRLGTAERGEYTAEQGKFTLSGGQPTLADALGNTTTGRELTFFLANDTILVNSQKGSRTLTKHRVEK
jgi:LPS export ABC transporter protein LptC